ncbi:SAF domain-containing protein [Piscibacillus salipiscarius]|uniref:SAF domain-containing protein n=1 Tax=Piscibacillus salipiscarius TaxID=299480 RepID=UPI0006CF2E41|nr:SAF domain-containing protein [Piscibacillus salipiscarius]
MLESKRKALIFLLLAIILAATSGYLILQKVQSLNEDLGTFVTVYKANGDIASRKIITASDVTTEQIPQRYLRDDYITSESQLTNMVSLVPLTEGDIITDTMLKEASAITSENTRLITLIQSERIFSMKHSLQEIESISLYHMNLIMNLSQKYLWKMLM